jgi:uncharacterized protein YbjT (DUF2867 family)
MILVVGATGLVGSEICYALACKGIPFRALVRRTSNPARLERLKNYGGILAQGDLRDVRSLQAVCLGVEAVICTASAVPFSYQPGVNDLQKVDLEGVENLIDIARAEAARQFIYISCKASCPVDSPLLRFKRSVEQHLLESGLPFSILRPGYLMEIWFSPAVGFDAVCGKATIYGTGDRPIAWISLKDVAQFAVESLENAAARNGVLEISGPELLSPHQAVTLFEKATGKTFVVSHIPPEVLQARYDHATDPMQKSITGLMLGYSEGDPMEVSAIHETFTIRLTPLKEYFDRLNGQPKSIRVES